jgi:hypothetical protein
MSIKAIITGSTGMVGRGVLYECLDNPEVEAVLTVNRQPLNIQHKKLKEIIHSDFMDISTIQSQLAGYNACFFCMGVSSVGMNEEKYYKVTYELTLHWAATLQKLNHDMVFCYVSGTGTDSTEKGRTMWARIKGKTENAILALSFKDAYMFRPGYIQPMKGIKSKTPLYNAMYVIFKPLYPVLKALFPTFVTSTVQVGKAMISAALKGYGHKLLENRDINILAGLI